MTKIRPPNRTTTIIPLLVCLCLSSGCVYRFAKLHAPPPSKIALEAIYNTEARYLPHNNIWMAVQTMLARNGRLAAYHAAEQLLRIHLQDSEVTTASAHTELQLTAAVELWDLAQQRLLFNTVYRLDSRYQTIFAEQDVPRSHWFIRAEATRTSAIARIGAELARHLQRDLFITLD